MMSQPDGTNPSQEIHAIRNNSNHFDNFTDEIIKIVNQVVDEDGSYSNEIPRCDS
jgi:hypothetical protein